MIQFDCVFDILKWVVSTTNYGCLGLIRDEPWGVEERGWSLGFYFWLPRTLRCSFSGVIELPILGGIKQCKCLVILRDLISLLAVHCLGLQYNDPWFLTTKHVRWMNEPWHKMWGGCDTSPVSCFSLILNLEYIAKSHAKNAIYFTVPLKKCFFVPKKSFGVFLVKIFWCFCGVKVAF